jgi:hypothetical protein
MSWTIYRHSDPSNIERVFGQNAGIDAALRQLEEMKRQGHDIKFIDTAEMNDAERTGKYLSEAAVCASYHHYVVHGVYGSNSDQYRSFGVGVPALRIERSSPDDPGDIYPHEKDGKYVTIHHFLNRIGASAHRARA